MSKYIIINRNDLPPQKKNFFHNSQMEYTRCFWTYHRAKWSWWLKQYFSWTTASSRDKGGVEPAMGNTSNLADWVQRTYSNINAKLYNESLNKLCQVIKRKRPRRGVSCFTTCNQSGKRKYTTKEMEDFRGSIPQPRSIALWPLKKSHLK